MDFYVRIPLWKAYLYTLIQRIRLYKRLNSNKVNLNLNRKEVVLLNKVFRENLSKGVMRKPKAFRYDELLQSVLVDNIASSTEDEVNLAFKLLWISTIKPKELIMEIKELKLHAKEVGLKPLAMAKINDETELIKTFLKAIDPQKEYSEEFVAFYHTIPDKYFDMVDGETTADETVADDLSELIDVINQTDDLDELKEICQDDDFKHLFESLKLGRFKSIKSLNKAMLGCLTPDVAEEAEAEDELDDETREMMIEAINEIDDDDDDALIEFISDEDVEAYFQDKLDIGDEIDVVGLKAQMLEILGANVEEEEQEEQKPMTLKERMAAKKAEKEGKAKPAAKATGKKLTADDIEFDPEDFDSNEVYALVEELGLPQLRKFAKGIGVAAPAKTSKDELLELVANALVELSEGETNGEEEEMEVSINKALVEDTIAADDKETLIAMCEAMGIKLNAIQKKSSKVMGNKLMEVVPDAPQDDDSGKKTVGKRTLKSAAKDAPAAESQSIYQSIEQMVLDGVAENEIIKSVKHWYVEKGHPLVRVKQRVKAMIAIVEGDYGIKK
jgi:hypothetical protein